MAFAIDGKVGADLEKRSTTPEFKLGTTVLASDNRGYVYVQANGAIAAAATAAVDSSFQATSGAGGYTADTAFADNEYGFIRKTAVAV